MLLFTDKLYQELEIKLNQLQIEIDNEALKAKESFQAVLLAMQKLKEFVKSYQFKDAAEEVAFFKEVKPKFFQHLIFHKELIYISSEKPRGDRKKQIGFLREMIADNNKFIQRHKSIHAYYLFGETRMDSMWFMRKPELPFLYPSNSVDLDDAFSTAVGNVLAKVLALEKLNEYLGSEIHRLKHSTEPTTTPAPDMQIVWTDSKSALIELIYGLHSHGCFNRGRCTVQQIAVLFEFAFSVKLGNFYRTFQSMRLRKKNRTAFLDSVSDSLENRMEDSDLLS